ncbi:hypothetical protein Tco_0633534 [Tanacetum coccineum]
MYRIASTTTQTRTPQLPHASRNTNPHMSKFSRVIHTTSVSRPQLKYLKDVNARTKKPRVVPISASNPREKRTNLLQHPIRKQLHQITHLEIKSYIGVIVQLILFIVDSGCTKHMTGNLKLLCNFVEKFLGTVRFGNDQFAPILGYGDLIQGNPKIKRENYLFWEDLQGMFTKLVYRGSDLTQYLFKETTSSTQSVHG